MNFKSAELKGAGLSLSVKFRTESCDLDPKREYVIYCHTGNRSALATDYLRRMGFGNVKNLKGGIDEWARVVDSTMTRY